MRNLIKHSLVYLLVSFSIGAVAAETSVLSLKQDIQKGDLQNPQGLWPFLGIGAGVTDSQSDIRTGGIPLHLKVLGSYYFDKPFVVDLGLGLHNHFLTQKGERDDTIQSLYTELAGRYELTNRWQLGAIWNTLVDNPDRYQSNTDNLASFMGVQVLKEFSWNDEYLVRAGGRAMTDIGISGGTIDTFMAELEVSFGGPSNARAELEPVKIQSDEEPQAVAPHLATRAIQTYVIDPKPVNFETDSTTLVSTSKVYLRRLARALATNRHLFDRIQVVGHADQRGPDNYNNKLSARRARAIADSLIASGISRAQIETDARGESEPLAQSLAPGALMRNRRAQIEFYGVQNQAALKNIIDSVQ